MLEIVFILHIINSHGNWLELLPFHFGHAVKIYSTFMNHKLAEFRLENSMSSDQVKKVFFDFVFDKKISVFGFLKESSL